MPSQEGLAKFDPLAKAYSEARERLGREVRELEERQRHLFNSRIPGIKSALAAAKEAEHRLVNAIQAGRTYFEKPKSYTWHGIKFGYQKGKGKIEWEDDAQVIKLIRKHFPEQTDTLINVTEKPVKTALNDLSSAELKRLGVTVIESGEQVFIKPVDGDVEKLVKALMKDDPEDGEGGA